MLLNQDFDAGVNSLDKLNLFVDADIILPKISHSDTDSFDLFDVYNPGHDRGTKLIVTKLGYWTKGKLKEKYKNQRFPLLKKKFN